MQLLELSYNLAALCREVISVALLDIMTDALRLKPGTLEQLICTHGC